MVVSQLPGAQGLDLIKGFVSWEWEQCERKEGKREEGRGGTTNGTGGRRISVMVVMECSDG